MKKYEERNATEYIEVKPVWYQKKSNLSYLTFSKTFLCPAVSLRLKQGLSGLLNCDFKLEISSTATNAHITAAENIIWFLCKTFQFQRFHRKNNLRALETSLKNIKKKTTFKHVCEEW